MARTGEKIFKSDVTEGARYGLDGIASIMMPTYEIVCKTPDNAESFKDYIIFHIITSESMCYGNECTDITLPGDIHIGSKYNLVEDIETMYGKCDNPSHPSWWNIGDDNPGWSYDPEVGCTMEEADELERGYGLNVDFLNGVTGIEILISDDKLKELYGN